MTTRPNGEGTERFVTVLQTTLDLAVTRVHQEYGSEALPPMLHGNKFYGKKIWSKNQFAQTRTARHRSRHDAEKAAVRRRRTCSLTPILQILTEKISFQS